MNKNKILLTLFFGLSSLFAAGYLSALVSNYAWINEIPYDSHAWSEPEVMFPWDTPTYPRTLFHGSSKKNLKRIEPRSHDHWDGQPTTYATPHIALASIFMLNFEDSWAAFGTRPNGTFVFLCSDKERFLKEDRGGTIYIIPSDSFYCHTNLCLGPDEWVSHISLKPLTKLTFKSIGAAMLSFGVQLFFVNQKQLDKYWKLFEKESIQPLNKFLASLEQTVTSENKNRNINAQSIT